MHEKEETMSENNNINSIFKINLSAVRSGFIVGPVSFNTSSTNSFFYVMHLSIILQIIIFCQVFPRLKIAL